MSAEAYLLLHRAADRLEKGWTQGTYARDIRGDEVILENGEGVSFCISGACRLEASFPHGDLYTHSILNPALSALAAEIGPIFFIDWNDSPERTQAEVVSALRRAASRLVVPLLKPSEEETAGEQELVGA